MLNCPYENEVKLTAKGLMAKLDILQKQRKSKFDKASQLKKTIQELMSNRENENEVKGMFEKFETQCKEAKEAHESLIALLLDEEKDRHETWFKAKMIWVVEFSTVVCKWCEKLQEEFDCAASEIEPKDSISNVETSGASRNFS